MLDSPPDPAPAPARPPGRPAGESTTREQVLRAAAASFLEHGYERTTLRGIARAVGVDVSTVVHHGGAKHELVARALALEVAPAELLARALDAPRDRVPDTLVDAVTAVWSDASRRRPLELLLATALTEPRVREACRSYLEVEVVRRLAEAIGGRDATTRALTVVSLVAGAFVTRHALGVAPHVPADEPLRSLVPVLRSVLAGPGRGGPARPGTSRPGGAATTAGA